MRSFFARLADSSDASVEAHIVLGACAVLGFVGLAVYNVAVLKQPFDPSGYGTGLSLTFAGSGAAALAQAGQRRIEGAPPSTGQ